MDPFRVVRLPGDALDECRCRIQRAALERRGRKGDPLFRNRRTLKQRAAEVLAYYDRPGTSNGPTEAINGRLEHLRGTALGFRNLTNYIARSLLETGGFRNHLHPHLRRAPSRVKSDVPAMGRLQAEDCSNMSAICTVGEVCPRSARDRGRMRIESMRPAPE